MRRTAWLCACLVQAHRRGPRLSKACHIPGAMLDVLHVYRHDLDSRRRALMTEVILKVMQQASIRTLSLAGHARAPFADSQEDLGNTSRNHIGPSAGRSHLLESVMVSPSHLVIHELCRTWAALCVQLLGRIRLCDPVDCSPPGSSVHGTLQARILERVAISSSRRSSRPRDWTHDSLVSCFAGGFFVAELPGEAPYSALFIF